jgi:hypothetical protein
MPVAFSAVASKEAAAMFQWVGSVVDAIVDGIKAIPGVRQQRRQKRILRAMLEQDSHQWRKLSTLARAVGESGPEGQERVQNLLLSIGARRSVRENPEELWGLISRVGASGVASGDVDGHGPLG